MVVVASIVSEALEEGIIEDTAFLASNLFGCIASAAFCYSEYKKSKEYEDETEEGKHICTDEKSEKNTNNTSAAKLIC